MNTILGEVRKIYQQIGKYMVLQSTCLWPDFSLIVQWNFVLLCKKVTIASLCVLKCCNTLVLYAIRSSNSVWILSGIILCAYCLLSGSSSIGQLANVGQSVITSNIVQLTIPCGSMLGQHPADINNISFFHLIIYIKLQMLISKKLI